MENKDLSRLKGGNEDRQIRNKDLSRVGMRTHEIRNKDPFRVRIRTTI